MIYAVDGKGTYLGEFEALPDGAVEVRSPPILGGDTWDGLHWTRKTKFYVDVAGNYLGGFDNEPPKGAKEVSSAPQHGSQIWAGKQWGAIPHDVINLQMEQARRQAFALEAEPLRLDAIYSGDTEMLAWHEKCADINARYPIK